MSTVCVQSDPMSIFINLSFWESHQYALSFGPDGIIFFTKVGKHAHYITLLYITLRHGLVGWCWMSFWGPPSVVRWHQGDAASHIFSLHPKHSCIMLRIIIPWKQTATPASAIEAGRWAASIRHVSLVGNFWTASHRPDWRLQAWSAVGHRYLQLHVAMFPETFQTKTI